MRLRTRAYAILQTQHRTSVIKLFCPAYHCINRQCIASTTGKDNAGNRRKTKFDLPTPVDPQVKFVNVSTKNLGVTSVEYIRASYTDENPEGSRIAFTIHGIPGSHYDFRYLAMPLCKAGIRLIRINLPGFGSTIKPHDYIYTPVNKANFIVGLLQAIGINKVDVGIAHSMGCPTVAAMVSTHPNFISLYALLSSPGSRPNRIFRPYFLIKLLRYPLETPGLKKATAAMLNLICSSAGINLDRTIKDEIANGYRVSTNFGFKFNGQNLKLLGDKKLPVLLAYSIDDYMIQNAIYNELTSLLGMKTLSELASLEYTHGITYPHIAYDVTIGKSRQLVFNKGGHFIQKFHASYISGALLEMLNDL